LSSPQHKNIHLKGRKLLEMLLKHDKEAGQKLLLNGRSCTHGYHDESFEEFGENSGRKFTITF
jgi:hypothetical protein